MLLFVIYILSGVITSNYLARRKMKFAEIAHAIFFVVFGFFLLFMPLDDIRRVAEIIIGKSSYEILAQVIYAPLQSAWVSFSVLTLLSATTIALIIIAISIVAVENIFLLKIPSNNVHVQEEEKIYNDFSPSVITANKLFLINCRLRN